MSGPRRLPEGEGADSASNHEEEPKNINKNDQEEISGAGDDLEDSGSEGFFNKVDKLRSTTTIATRARGRVARQVQVASTVSKTHTKAFIPVDFQAIRQGFLEGGVKSTDRTSTSSTSPKLQHLIKDTHLVIFRSIHLRTHHLPQPTTAHLCGANRQTEQAKARYVGPRCRDI